MRSENDSFTWLEFRDATLLETLRVCFPDLSSLYDRKPGMDCRDLYVQRRKLESAICGLGDQTALKEALSTLLDFLLRKFSWMCAIQDWGIRNTWLTRLSSPEKLKQFPDSTISWNLLWCLFEVGQDVETLQDGSNESMAATIDSWHYAHEAMGK